MGAALPVTYRPLGAEEDALLLEASLGNFNWKTPLFTPDQVLRRPDLARYTRVDPDRGDFGVVAQQRGEPVGVAWALYLPADAPGYGWIDPVTPEFCVWVDEPWRGRGIGRLLTRQLLAAARARLIPRLSLSVDRRNMRAKMLYMDLGFVPVPGGETYGVLLWTSPGM
ncbi:GNAT family N-acetyltransferase [Leucobacter celer]|jgi:GNAT superfamily N-acetyltransferase|uniref:GNAT family N-acetyltransferase n=1 Tax=Leucobacter celer TaxID=668625 RepID=UPI0006A76F68|nr:GNAT family N-acetyltransferase [Leucobacter celer]